MKNEGIFLVQVGSYRQRRIRIIRPPVRIVFLKFQA